MNRHLPIIPHPIASHRTEDGNVYTLMSGQYFCRWWGDSLDYTAMEVRRDGKIVARLFDGSTYGWGKIHGNLSPIRRLGHGFDMFDHNIHDTGPRDDIGEALKLVSFRAEYIEKKRAEIRVA
jgi:hypothetical protein